MRKNFLSVIILTIGLFFVVSCEKGKLLPIKVEPDMTLLKIERCLQFFSNPVITVLAKKVSFDYNQRSIVIEGLINIAGNKGGVSDWVVPEMIIKENSIFISLPTDSNYNMQIGDARFYLPFIEK